MLKLSVIAVAATGNFDAKTIPLLLLRADTNFENISTDLVPRKELRFKKRRHDPESSVAPSTLLLSSHQPPTSIRQESHKQIVINDDSLLKMGELLHSV